MKILASYSLGELIFAVLTSSSVLGLIGILVNNWFQRRKVSAEVRRMGVDGASVLTSSAISLLEPMQKQLDEMAESLAETKRELKRTQENATELRIQVRRLLIELSDYRDLNTGERRVIDGY